MNIGRWPGLCCLEKDFQLRNGTRYAYLFIESMGYFSWLFWELFFCFLYVKVGM